MVADVEDTSCKKKSSMTIRGIFRFVPDGGLIDKNRSWMDESQEHCGLNNPPVDCVYSPMSFPRGFSTAQGPVQICTSRPVHRKSTVSVQSRCPVVAAGFNSSSSIPPSGSMAFSRVHVPSSDGHNDVPCSSSSSDVRLSKLALETTVIELVAIAISAITG